VAILLPLWFLQRAWYEDGVPLDFDFMVAGEATARGRTMQGWWHRCHELHAMAQGGTFMTRGATRVTAMFLTNQTVRWAAKKLVHAWLARKCASRLVGDVDFTTLEAVKPDEAVDVACTTARSTFRLSAQGLVTAMIGALQYAAYGVPEPRAPCNPYTNVPWTTGQLTAAWRALCGRLGARGLAPPSLLVAYREAAWDIAAFKTANAAVLNRRAVAAYFSPDLSDPDARDDFAECLWCLGLGSAVAGVRMDKEQLRAVLRGELPPPLLARWLGIVRDHWYSMNCRTPTVDRAVLAAAVAETTVLLHAAKRQIVRSRRPSAPSQRGSLPPPPRAAAVEDEEDEHAEASDEWYTEPASDSDGDMDDDDDSDL
jgi:hypothetical protein